MTVAIPDEVADLLTGWPAVGQWEQMLPLLTVDEDDGVRVCLMSRAELSVAGRLIDAVVASPSTAANLRRTGLATLMTIATDNAIYCRLKSVVQRDLDGQPLGVRFQVTSVKKDGLGIGLTGSQYYVDPSLVGNENWALSRQILAELKATVGITSSGDESQK